MPLDNPIGEFAFESKGATVVAGSGGGGSIQVNYEGPATG
jgi:hypothetical protein